MSGWKSLNSFKFLSGASSWKCARCPCQTSTRIDTSDLVRRWHGPHGIFYAFVAWYRVFAAAFFV